MVVIRARVVLFGLGLRLMAKGLDLGNQTSGRIRRHRSHRPGREHRGKIASAFEPSVLKAKTVGLGDRGGDGEG